MWGNDVFMNISQIKKLRKIVKIKKLAMKNNKLFVCTMNRMVLSLLPCHFFPRDITIFWNKIYAYLCFQSFPKQFIDEYVSNHLYGQEARNVFIQHPRYNPEVFLKKMKDGRATIHRHWPKVARTFNIIEGSIFAFRFNSFLDETHLSIYRL